MLSRLHSYRVKYPSPPGRLSGLEIRDQTFDTYCASRSNWDIFKDKGHFHVSIGNENELKGQFIRSGSVYNVKRNIRIIFLHLLND
jgi:hypothetical protein